MIFWQYVSIKSQSLLFTPAYTEFCGQRPLLESGDLLSPAAPHYDVRLAVLLAGRIRHLIVIGEFQNNVDGIFLGRPGQTQEHTPCSLYVGDGSARVQSVLQRQW